MNLSYGAKNIRWERSMKGELRKKQIEKEKFVLLDARNKKSYKEAHIKGALLPRTNDYYKDEELFKRKIVGVAPDEDVALAEKMKEYPKDTQFYTYCNTGCQASAVLVIQLHRLGFKNARAMEDGFQVWEKKGYPVTRPTSINPQNVTTR